MFLSLSSYLSLPFLEQSHHFLLYSSKLKAIATPTARHCKPSPPKKNPPSSSHHSYNKCHCHHLPQPQSPTTKITNPNPQPHHHQQAKSKKRKITHQNHKPKLTTSSPPTIGKRKTTHQNHKPVILSQSPLKNPTTSTENHQHPPKTTVTLIKNSPKPITRPTSWATHKPWSQPIEKKKKKREEEEGKKGRRQSDRNGR